MAIDPAQLALVDRDADAIEHALYEGRLFNLGLRSDAEVSEQIDVNLAEAGPGTYAMAALAAADYCENPQEFAPRRWAALWRACQLHGCEDLYWALSGPDLTHLASRASLAAGPDAGLDAAADHTALRRARLPERGPVRAARLAAGVRQLPRQALRRRPDDRGRRCAVIFVLLLLLGWFVAAAVVGVLLGGWRNVLGLFHDEDGEDE